MTGYLFRRFPRTTLATALFLIWGFPWLANAAFDLQEVVTGLDRPVFVTHAGDGSSRLFIVEQGGRIRLARDGELLETPFLDISSLVRAEAQQGLLSVAFHPIYVSTGLFYVIYTDTDGNSVVARYTVSPDDPNIADSTSGVPVLTIPQPFEEHNGGHLQFSPRDGYLYIGVGDGGAVGDPHNNAQNPMLLLGKLVRIDIDSDFPYGIPPDNPFIGSTGALPEIWAQGLRNPWRFSFDRMTGDLYIADVGEDNWEEVNFQAAHSLGGENYGWRLREGKECFAASTDCNQAGLALPVHTYDHAKGCAVIGGHVYRGTHLPALFGTYLFGDYCARAVWGLRQTVQGAWVQTTLIKTDFMLSSFGEAESGELYAIDYYGGRVLKLVPVPIRLGGIVDGLTGKIFCRNYMRRSKWQSTVSTLSWGCNDLRAKPGAYVQVTLEGRATSSTISGLVTGLEITEVTCTNRTNRKRVIGIPAPTWGCGDLPITTGDKVTIRVHGRVS
jgi:glucose/arabinose dehydrogenase